MAAGTRSKEALEEGLRNTDSRLQELMNSHHHLQKTVETIGEKFGHLQTTMDMMISEFQRNLKGKAPASTSEVNPETPTDSPRTAGIAYDKGLGAFNGGWNTRNMNPKFDFPVFNGLEIKNWVMKCENFFQFTP